MKPSTSATRILIALITLMALALTSNHQIDGFAPALPTHSHSCSSLSPSSSSSSLRAAKGFGATPKNSAAAAASSSSKKEKNPSNKQLIKTLESTYGGTTPEAIARGTQRRIDSTLQSQPPHVQMCLKIYQQLQGWKLRISGMSDLDLAKRIPPDELEGATRARVELDRILQEHSMTTTDLHNILQQATWDASADAKVVRSMSGKMSKENEQRVQTGCAVVAEAVGGQGNVLDVGCGFGVMVPFLRKAGVAEEQIHGIDLSPEMIRHAEQLYPKCHFQSNDFLTLTVSDESKDKYEAVFFCSSLHDMPDRDTALQKAASLLTDNGRLVIMHPQGASHVKNMVRSNPAMVPRGLPNVAELKAALPNLELQLEPAAPKSRQETSQGYLAVLVKK